MAKPPFAKYMQQCEKFVWRKVALFHSIFKPL